MILGKITKGNFNLELTKKTYKHENNLRFHVKIDERFYEYAIDTWNYVLNTIAFPDLSDKNLLLSTWANFHAPTISQSLEKGMSRAVLELNHHLKVRVNKKNH